ncbi:MAG: PTS transporter subunit EIIC, partial [Anaerococcus sp.]|nr:PTS transporter subunit EIIC [Anaerococcus sp.]
SENVAGEMISGAQNIYFAQLADPTHVGLYTRGTRFFAGRFDTMIFGLPAACLGMYHSIPKENRAKNKGFYVSAALTSFLTGITEPIEFSFLFAAPWLYVIHAFFDGLSFFLADLFNIRVGNTFSGGLIDFILFGPLQGNAKTNWIRVIPIGIIWAILYYFLFRSLVSKFKIAIPGMQVEEGNKKENIVSDNNSDLENKSIQIIDALGNQENIEYVTACATRLRVTVKDKEKIDQELLKNLGATAVLEVENGIQAVFGSKANIYSSKINEILGRDD